MKRIIALVTLLLAAASAQAHNMAGMPITTFPNNYTVARTVSYDASTGQAGTVRLSYLFTGTTQQSPMCGGGAHHTPQVVAKLLVNGAQTAQSTASGTGIGPCVQMNQTLTVSFDLFSDSCTLDLLMNGTCTLAEQTDVDCTVAGVFTVFPSYDLQFETAVTFSTISALLNSNGLHPQAPYCYAPSMPPDLAPATQASPSVKPGQYVESAFMWREVPSGGSFLLVPWHRVIPIDPETWMPPTFNAPICTNWDAGFRDIPWPL